MAKPDIWGSHEEFVKPTREERFTIHCQYGISEANKQQYNKLVEEAESELKLAFKALNDDYNFTYNFDIKYFGQIVSDFELLIKILPLMKQVKIQTFTKEAKCLIQELLCKLEYLEQKYAKK